MFTIKQLESFKLVVQHGTAAQAAVRLHTTESAVAKRLRELESALGVPLFRRDGRRQVLSEKGQEIWQQALALLDLRDAIVEVARSPDYKNHSFRLGMTELVAHLWLTALVEGIRNHHRDLQIEPHIGLSLDMMELLRQGDLDLAILPTAARQPQMSYLPLFRNVNRWVSQPGYAEAKQALSAHEVARYPLVLQDSHSILNQTVQQWFSAQDAPMPRLVTCNSLKGAKDLVMAGFGVGYLPEIYCRPDIEAGRLQVFSVRPAIATRSYHAVYPKRSQPGLASELAGEIRKVLAAHPARP